MILHITCYLDVFAKDSCNARVVHIYNKPYLSPYFMPNNYFSHPFILKLSFFYYGVKVSISLGLGLIGKMYL